MSRATRIGSALAGLLVATGMLAGAPAAHAQQSLPDVTVTDTEFTPKEVQVKVNELVVFQLQGTRLDHSVTSVDGDFNLTFGDDGVVSMRLPEAKSYAYFCRFAKGRNAFSPAFPQMDGVIVVSEPGATTTTSSTTTSSTTSSSTTSSSTTTSSTTSSSTTSSSTTSTTATTQPTTSTSATTTPTTVPPTTRPAVTTSTTRPPGTTTAPTVATTATTAPKAAVQGASQSTTTTKKKKSTTTTAKKKKTKKATRPARAKPKVQRTTTTSTTLPSLTAALPSLTAALPSGAGEVPAASEADLPDATEAGDEAASWVGDKEDKGDARKMLLFGLGGLGALGLASAGLGWSRRSGRYLST